MSKQFTLISLLVALLSACTQQVTAVTPSPEQAQATQLAPSKTVEPQATLSINSAWTDMTATRDAISRPTDTEMPPTVAVVSTAALAACPGAPGPYAAIGKQVTVVAENVDKLKLRSEPKISPDTVIKELDRFTQLKIVGGPLCIRATGASYWFWQVEVLPGRQIGWVAEGDVQHSFITVSVGEQHFPENTPTATISSACPGPHAPFFAGLQVIVIASDSDKLKLRSEPEISPDTIIKELDQFTPLQIAGGPVCVTSAETGISYWLWKVKVRSSGKIGWVAEGDGHNYFVESNAP